MNARFAAHAFAVLALGAAGFQLLLALGAPWGALTWGGRFSGQLPSAMRGVAVLSMLFLAASAAIVEVRVGCPWPRRRRASSTLVWVVVG